MAEKYPHLTRFKKLSKLQNRSNPKNSIPRNVIKLLKTKDIEKILKAVQKK